MHEPEAARTFWDVMEPTTEAWRQKRELAAVLHELNAICVTTDAPDTALREATEAAQRIVDSLSGHPRRTFKEGYPSCTTLDDFRLFADRGALVRLSHPFAPPMRFHMEPAKDGTDGEIAVGQVTFGPVFEGIPGCVHGGLVAAAFDQLFGYLQVKRGIRSLTGSLAVRYKKPTPLYTELRLEAHVDRTRVVEQGADANARRSSFIVARILAGEVVTATAEAIFVTLDAERMQSVIAAENPAEG